jgi:hypothetical protein
MAQLNKGTTIAPTTTVTAQTLHDLIDQATITGLSAADIVGGVFFVSVSTSTPNPSLAPFWYNPDPEDPMFRVYAAPWNIWLSVGPDRYEIPLKNSSGVDLLRGALVVCSGASDFTIGSNPSLNAIGFLQAPTAAGAYGPVATCGIGWALYCSSISITSPAGGTPDAKLAVVARGTPAGTVAGYSIDGALGSGPMFGMWLESNRSGASGSNAAKRALIWGPKLTAGF